MEPTVDLEVNSSTGEHKIVVVLGTTRIPLEPTQAARLSADLATVISFTLHSARPAVEQPEPAKLKAVPNPEPEDEEETSTPRVSWHKKVDKQGQTIGYRTDLAGAGVAEVTPASNKGWNLKINGKPINQAPIGKKADAYVLVNEILQKNALSV